MPDSLSYMKLFSWSQSVELGLKMYFSYCLSKIGELQIVPGSDSFLTTTLTKSLQVEHSEVMSVRRFPTEKPTRKPDRQRPSAHLWAKEMKKWLYQTSDQEKTHHS